MAVTDLVNTAVLLIAGAALIAVLIAYVYSFRYFVRYELENNSLKIRICGLITVRKIDLGQIEEIALVDWRQMTPFSRSFEPKLLFSERWGGYRVGHGVVLKKRSGIMRTIIISPKEPEKLVEAINSAKSGNR